MFVPNKSKEIYLWWETNYHVGIKFTAMNNQYVVVPRIRAFFDPRNRTTNAATKEKTVKDEYKIPSEIVPKSSFWNQNSIQINQNISLKIINYSTD